MDPQDPGTTPAAPIVPAAQPQPPVNPGNPAAPVNVYVQAPTNPGAPAAPAPPAAPAGTIAPPPAAPPAAPGMVPISLEQLQAFASLQARVAQMEAEQHARDQAAQAEQARILAERGQAIEALNLARQQHEQAVAREQQRAADIERSAARYALDGELSRALAAHNLVPGGAEQLGTLWRGLFSAVNENGTYAVRNAQFEGPAAFVGRMLTDPNQGYAHFLRPTNPGGGTQQNPAAPAPVNPAAQQQPIPAPADALPPPRNYGEAVLRYSMERGIAPQPADAATNPRAGFGGFRTPAPPRD